MPKVALSTGVERREILRKAAYSIRSETAKQITARPVIMPRISPPGSELTRTRGDAIRGILDELINFHDDEIKYFKFEEIIICGNRDEMEGMDQFQSAERMKSLPIRVENLYQNGPWEEIQIENVHGETETIRVNRRIKNSKFRISVSVPSSDPAFGMFGGVQNMIFAVHPADRVLLQGVPQEARLADERAVSASSSLLIPNAVEGQGGSSETYSSTHRELREKVSSYQDTEEDVRLQYRTLYRNLSNLAQHLMPDLSFIDGTYVVDGTGTRHDGGFALSGDDPVAVDTVLARILDQDIGSLGHLQYLNQMHYGVSDEEKIKVVIGNPEDLDIEFAPHPDENRRLGWHHVRLPGENGEAVGYIPPDEEREEPEETEQTEEASGEEKTDEEQGTAEGTGDESTDKEETEPVDGAGASEVEGDSARERIRQRLKDRGKLEGEASSGTDRETETTSEPEAADEGTGEVGEETSEDSEVKTDEDTTDQDQAGKATVDEEDLSVRERVRRRLIRRGKMEGDLPEEAKSTDTDERGTEPDGPKTSPEKEEPAADEQSEEDEPAEGESEEPEQETEREPAEGEEPTAEGESVAVEGDDVRERVRNRLIQRGKLEGEEAETGQPSAEKTEEDTADVDQREPSKEETAPADKQSADEEKGGEESEETADGSPEEAQETAAGTPAAEQDLELRERVERRLIRRGKMEGELPDEDVPETEGGEEEAAEEAAASVEAPEQEEQADRPAEKVEVTESSGPAVEPSKEVQDADEVLQNLSSYEPEEKLRHRLAIRKQAVEGTGRDDGRASGASEPEESGDEPHEETAGEEDGAPEEEAVEEPAADAPEEDEDRDVETSEEDETGYERDPDLPLRERVEKRLSERGKI